MQRFVIGVLLLGSWLLLTPAPTGTDQPESVSYCDQGTTLSVDLDTLDAPLPGNPIAWLMPVIGTAHYRLTQQPRAARQTERADPIRAPPRITASLA